MSGKTKIEWADRTWNPVTGCTKVSEGCRNCYAERYAQRFWGERKFSEVQVHWHKLNEPMRWRAPARVFVNSMSDLFHEDVSDEFIHKVFRVMYDNPKHIFMILTKRPERMISRVPVFPVKNVWLGVSVENQVTAEERIPYLLHTPAAVRFVSVEPMLGPVALWGAKYDHPYGRKTESLTSGLGGLDWVICGGESGPGARSMRSEWVKDLRDQCVCGVVPFFFKQWGEYLHLEPGQVMDDRKKASRLLDGREWNEFPEVK